MAPPHKYLILCHKYWKSQRAFKLHLQGLYIIGNMVSDQYFQFVLMRLYQNSLIVTDCRSSYIQFSSKPSSYNATGFQLFHESILVQKAVAIIYTNGP